MVKQMPLSVPKDVVVVPCAVSHSTRHHRLLPLPPYVALITMLDRASRLLELSYLRQPAWRRLACQAADLRASDGWPSIGHDKLW